MGTPFTQSGWVLERQDRSHGNFEAMFACPVTPVSSTISGLTHVWWDNGGLSDPTASGTGLWNTAETIRNSALPGPWLGASLILSNYGNLEAIVAHNDGQLAHFALVGIWGWRGPAFLPGRSAGAPAFIQSGFGRRGNFEVIVPRPGGGLSHFFRDNDHGETWHEAPQPNSSGDWSGVGLIHSNFGNLEVVGVMDGNLVFIFQNGLGGPWSAPMVIARGFRGRPAFIQSGYGGHGNFEAVGASVNGGLTHFWRNNDSPNFPWSGPFSFGSEGERTYDDVTMFQSSFGHLEVYARGAGETLVSWFRAAWAAPWAEPLPSFVMECE